MLGQEAEEERMGGGRLLNGWEAGEIYVNIIFAIKKKQSKGRKPRRKGQKLGMQDTGGWRLRSLFPPPTVPRYITIIHRSEVVNGG